MKSMNKRFKNGAASFYIVAFSTLILVILAVSFASVIISEVTRTSNDDLSQSAYDSALAGIEDAKLAYANYQRCAEAGYTIPASISGGNDVTCEDIMYWMANPDCDMVAHILGRISKSGTGEVLVAESSNGGNNLNQAYTCVKIKTNLSDYRASLSASNPTKVVKVELDKGVNIYTDGDAGGLKGIRLSWYSNPGGEKYNYNNFTGGRVAFQQISTFRAATPPTIAVQLVQTATAFTMEELFMPTQADGGTDRATVYLVPTSNKSGGDSKYSYNAYKSDKDKNVVSGNQMAATNNMAKNLPYTVYCPQSETAEFACTAEIYLPKPIQITGGGRSGETFMFAINIPYGQPDTDFSIEYLCSNDGAKCSVPVTGSGESDEAIIKDVQVMIDSTGRANDLYRRVETRFEASDVSFPYQFYAVEGLNSSNSGDYAIKKELTVTKEYGI